MGETACDDHLTEEVDESSKWDCESVLSLNSNISNRPGKIGNLKLLVKPKKQAAPLESLAEEDEHSEESEAESVIELPEVITERKKDETPEEKRARKASVKA